MKQNEHDAPADMVEERVAVSEPLEDDDEPTEQELRASVRRSMKQAFSGETGPVEEALAEIAITPSLDDADEPSTEALVEMLRQALYEANTGQTRPVEALLRELDAIQAENETAG